ncbi:MAG TPA: hypothetical protein VEQ59_25465, partial [Polyangiaceae bacterium]|nr:hypothetical protein [Polyangiaceae bacterium]
MAITRARSITRGVAALLFCGVGCGSAPSEERLAPGSASLSSLAAPVYASVTEPPFAVTSWGPQRIDIFARGLDDGLLTKSWDTNQWAPSQIDYASLGGPTVGAPSVVSWGPQRIDAFVRGVDSKLYIKSLTGGVWIGWASLGSPSPTVGVGARPAAVSWGPNRIDLIAPGTDRMLYIKSWTGSSWVPGQLADWNPLGGPIVGAPEAVSWGPDRLDIFVRKDDGNLYIKSWTGSTWVPSQSQFALLGAPAGAQIAAQPSVESWATDR